MTASGTGPSARGPGSPGDVTPMTRLEAAEYIASLLEGLRAVASSAQLPFLAYLISVALEEAKLEKSNRG
jgi:hypothetical protein